MVRSVHEVAWCTNIWKLQYSAILWSQRCQTHQLILYMEIIQNFRYKTYMYTENTHNIDIYVFTKKLPTKSFIFF
jgi:hypothetical protein